MPIIALVNDTDGVRSFLALKLKQAGYGVIQYADTETALELCRNPADLAILDRHNPPIGGVELFRRIRDHHDMSVVFMSAQAELAEEELRKIGLKADGYFDIPMSTPKLLSVVETALQNAKARLPMKFAAVVSAKLEFRAGVAARLRRCFIRPVQIGTTEKAERLCEDHLDAVILDRTLPALGIDDLAARIRANTNTRIVVLTARPEQARQEMRARNAEADCYIAMPSEPEAIAAAVSKVCAD